MNKISKTVVAGAVVAAMIVPASAAFAGQKTERAVLGAVIGGIAGAAIGDGDKGAIAIGAVAGAAIGASTAKDKNDRRYHNSYRSRPAYNAPAYNAYDNRGYRDQRYYGDRRNDRYSSNYYTRDYGYRR